MLFCNVKKVPTLVLRLYAFFGKNGYAVLCLRGTDLEVLIVKLIPITLSTPILYIYCFIN